MFMNIVLLFAGALTIHFGGVFLKDIKQTYSERKSSAYLYGALVVAAGSYGVGFSIINILKFI